MEAQNRKFWPVNISKTLWLWCLQRGITLRAQHLPGKEDLKADFKPRHLRDRTDWVLNPALFNLINQTWSPLLVDLFATRFSYQLPRFFSWRPNPEAEATDAFLQNWRNLQAYAHPPWCLIACVLAKALCQRVTLVLVTPCWPTQPWFPQLIEMLVDFPLVLLHPSQYEVITPSPNCTSPVLTLQPQLVKWKGLGDSFEQERFQKVLSNSFLSHGGRRQTPLTVRHGGNGGNGAVHTLPIPFQQVMPKFLMDEFKAGREYRSMNCYHLARSSTHLPIQGFAVGIVSVAKRCLQPDSLALWDVDKVLSFLRQLGANAQLSLKELTMKLIMLLALVLAHHSLDLTRLSVVGISELPEAISVRLIGLAKQSHLGHAGQSSVIVASFRADPYLCPVACLRLHFSDKGLRVHNRQQLLIAMVKPHKPVLSCTTARWKEIY